MINKIHSNVKQMLAEARLITQRHHSVHKLVSEHPKIEKNKIQWSFNHSYRQKSVEPKKRALTHLQTQQPETDYIKRKRTVTENSCHKSYMVRQDVIPLLPDESELLSTKLYGFQRQNSSPSKETDEQILPKINNKVNFQIKTNVLRQNAKKGKFCFILSSNRKESQISTRTIQRWDRSEINKIRRQNINLKDLKNYQHLEPIKLDCSRQKEDEVQETQVKAWEISPRFRQDEQDQFSL